MRKTLILAASYALLTVPALASDIVPQTFSSGPGSAGTIQQQDMERSDRASDLDAQAPATTSRSTGAPDATNRMDTDTPTGMPLDSSDPMDPQMNPHDVRK